MPNSIRKSALYLAAVSIALLLATGSAFADRYYSGDRDHIIDVLENILR
ncbi:MAG TPA: hypothetical protein VJY83_00820 [Thiopseudomonas sp.]|nr:hypothetical protein [Thiopseudomonas sp.]HZJ92993.1 hypothetical protein [Thiopseudomonas sp.]